jgi:hypothetical protein
MATEELRSGEAGELKNGGNGGAGTRRLPGMSITRSQQIGLLVLVAAFVVYVLIRIGA